MSSGNGNSNCPFMKYCPIAANQGMLSQGFPFIIQKQKPKVSMGDIIFYIFLGLWVLFIIFAFLESNSFFDELFQFPPNVKQQQPVQLKIYVSEPFPFQSTKKINKSDSDNESESDDESDNESDDESDNDNENKNDDENDDENKNDEVKAAEKKD